MRSDRRNQAQEGFHLHPLAPPLVSLLYGSWSGEAARADQHATTPSSSSHEAGAAAWILFWLDIFPVFFPLLVTILDEIMHFVKISSQNFNLHLGPLDFFFTVDM